MQRLSLNSPRKDHSSVAPQFQRATKARGCVPGRSSGRSVCESVTVKPRLQWRPQYVGDAGWWNFCWRKLRACGELAQKSRQAAQPRDWVIQSLRIPTDFNMITKGQSGAFRRFSWWISVLIWSSHFLLCPRALCLFMLYVFVSVFNSGSQLRDYLESPQRLELWNFKQDGHW